MPRTGSVKCKSGIIDRNEGKGKDYEFNHFLKLFYSNSKNFSEELEIIDKDVIKGRTDYTVFSYSVS